MIIITRNTINPVCFFLGGAYAALLKAGFWNCWTGRLSWAPHPGQNLTSPVTEDPQLGQCTEACCMTKAPQLGQNLLFAVTGAPHFWQFI
jgi:hypothetical protein